MSHDSVSPSPGKPVRTIILASASPRRQELVRELGVPVELRPVDLPETPLPGESPSATASRLALLKAEAAAARGGDGLVIGGDTIVVDGSDILGKPADPADAVAILRRLRDRAHQVITGVAVIDLATGNRDVRGVETDVWRRDYSDTEIAAYVASGAPLDKAGAYGIQDSPFLPVREIDGCYLCVVGLPLCAVARAIQSLGYALPPGRYADGACRCRDKAPSGVRVVEVR
jgi:septum formation protein